MKEKVELARSIMETKLLPTDWVYDNIFHLSEDQYDEYRDLITQDQKRTFRLKQIENEGNDPVESGKSYGTPHDLAYLYGKGRYADNPENVPAGYGDDLTLGRPEEKASDIGTQDNPFGNDRLGNVGMKKGDDTGEDKNLQNNFKGGSPLALENASVSYLKNKMIFESLDKKIVFAKKEDDGDSLLDESRLKE
jgi:hypothetical protein